MLLTFETGVMVEAKGRELRQMFCDWIPAAVLSPLRERPKHMVAEMVR